MPERGRTNGRASIRRAKTRGDETALDRLILAAVAPLRVSDEDVRRADAAPGELRPLSADRAARLAEGLRLACEKQRSGGPSELEGPPEGEDLQPFGAMVRAGRERAGLTVRQLAEELRVHRGYVGAIEAGENTPLALGPERIAWLVRRLALPPAAAGMALTTLMRAALGAQAAVLGRVDVQLAREERRRLLEASQDDAARAADAAAWERLIAAVDALSPTDTPRAEARPPHRLDR